MRNLHRFVLGAMLTLVFNTSSGGEPAVPLQTFTRLPMKEITVFKDGHAFVAHEGELPTDGQGNVILDYLPMPVLGTFWPYAAQAGAKLTSVVAGQRRVLVNHTALTIRELLEANVGAEVTIQEFGTNRFDAVILDLPARSGDELAVTSPPNTPDRLPERGNLVLLKTTHGTKVMLVEQIQQVMFKAPHKSKVACEEFRNLLTLRMDWAGAPAAKSARVGLFYLQKGIRWIPEYKIELDDHGSASVKMQATLINELADLEDISVNLVIGVPSFSFKDNVDPMALQQSLAQLSSYFQSSGHLRNSPVAYQFSNAIMSQSAEPAAYNPSASGPAVADLGPEIGGSGKAEDLFVFNVPHVTLRRGERLVTTIAEFKVPYQDLFALDLPFAPPPEVRCNFNNEQQRELARLLNAPKVQHKLRLTNQSGYPFTTGPALILKNRQVLAQSLVSFTSPGATVDVSLTTSVDFQVHKTDKEIKRTPDALHENGNAWSRIDLSGRISVTSHRAQPVALEVTRHVLGAADKADHNGTLEKVNAFEDESSATFEDYPYWWGWYGWPGWWNQVNGLGRITWKVQLEHDKPVELSYDWHYFWR